MGAEMVLALCACSCAFVPGFLFARARFGRVRAFSRVRSIRLRSGAESLDGRGRGRVGAVVLTLAAAASARVSADGSFWLKAFPRTARWFKECAPKAALADAVSPAGACAARAVFTVGATIFGFAVGLTLSLELAGILAVAGALAGWRSLPRAVGSARKERADEAERGLPHMLDVLAMGVRSGLSFDRSMQLYAQYFDTPLSRSCETARQQWVTGFLTREKALCALAASYDSELVSRVIGMMVRSLKLGSSLADDLAAAAEDARSAYAACRKESVAKAPVKMMVSTGVFMLPAMLLLVLGPILLELMGGF